MCCMVSLCPFGEDVPRGITGECGYLTIDDQDQTVCNCAEALEQYVGSGCHFQKDSMSDFYLFHINEYDVDARREALKEV